MNIITTPRLIIRRFCVIDGPALFSYLHQPSAPCFYDERVETLAAAHQEAQKRSTDKSQFAVCLKENNLLIGHIFADSEEGEPDRHTWSAGWHFSSAYQGNGYASESVRALFDYLFMQKMARRIYAWVEDYNIPSRKLCERLNMRQEACFKEFVSFTTENGQARYDDTLVFAILRKEWCAVETAIES